MVSPEELDGLTPIQVKVLRKEAMARKARNDLRSISFRAETEQQQEETLAKVMTILEQDEFVLVKSLSRDERKFVYEMSTAIAETLGETRTTFLLTVKGHSALYYSPNGQFPLRTTTKGNHWTKRMKAERDNRGQIVK